jgi:hypothetical protein
MVWSAKRLFGVVNPVDARQPGIVLLRHDWFSREIRILRAIKKAKETDGVHKMAMENGNPKIDKIAPPDRHDGNARATASRRKAVAAPAVHTEEYFQRSSDAGH